MLKEIFEDEYTHYDAKLKMKMLSQYLSKLPKGKTKFMKLLHFHGAEPTIYNIKTIMISPSIAEGKAAEDAGEKKIRIVYSDKAEVKAMTCSKFAGLSKKIFEELKDVDAEQVRVVCCLDGTSREGAFRFYVDDDTDFAMLVRYVNPQGVKAFVQAHEADLAKAMEVKENTKQKIAKEKKEAATEEVPAEA